MTPRQLGTVLLTIMGIGLVLAGILLGISIFGQMIGTGVSGEIVLRFLGALAVPIALGIVLLNMRETLAAKYLRDEPVQPSALVARDLVRVGVVLMGVWIVVESVLGLAPLVFGGGMNGWFRTILLALLSAAVGVIMILQSNAVTDMAWKQGTSTGGGAGAGRP